MTETNHPAQRATRMTPDESTDSVRVAADVRGLADLLHESFPCGDTSELDAPPCWTAAQRLLASDWLADVVAQAKAEALRGIRWRADVACDGYANLADGDVPMDITDPAAYQQGAHDAAEAIRSVLGAPNEATS